MNRLGFYWGICGVLLILLFAMVRLSARIIEMLNAPLSLLQWSVLFLFAVYMAYAEGYKGFHRNFAPRVIARARYFLNDSNSNNISHLIFAPLLCMGYIHATRKRQMISILLTSAIVILVLLIRVLPQPWRGIIDVGVVLGLFLGSSSVIYFWIQSARTEWQCPVVADFPD